MTVLSDVERLLRTGMVQEMPASARARGRPQIPVAIDPLRRNVVGVSLRPGSVAVARLNLLGALVGEELSASARGPRQMIAAAIRLVDQALDASTIGLGISAPGFVDPEGPSILFSSAFPSFGPVKLDRLPGVASGIPLVLENDTHAIAAHWLLRTSEPDPVDTLMIFLEDGQIGAALLIDGRPNRGCVGGGNELGHTRMQVHTRRCYCGQRGCIERIFSSDYAGEISGKTRRLSDLLAEMLRNDPAARRITGLLAEGLANAINFTRAGRIILTGELCEHRRFVKTLVDQMRQRLLPVLSQRVKFQQWTALPRPRSGEMAGWLALAAIYLEGWVDS